jgi:hypothetical protein
MWSSVDTLQDGLKKYNIIICDSSYVDIRTFSEALSQGNIATVVI